MLKILKRWDEELDHPISFILFLFLCFTLSISTIVIVSAVAERISECPAPEQTMQQQEGN